MSNEPAIAKVRCTSSDCRQSRASFGDNKRAVHQGPQEAFRVLSCHARVVGPCREFGQVFRFFAGRDFYGFVLQVPHKSEVREFSVERVRFLTAPLPAEFISKRVHVVFRVCIVSASVRVVDASQDWNLAIEVIIA